MLKKILLVLICLSFVSSVSSFGNDDGSGGSGGPKNKPPGTKGHDIKSEPVVKGHGSNG